MAEFELVGLRGDNPLAYLAALGTLRSAAGVWGNDARMTWRQTGGWRPTLTVERVDDRASLVAGINDWLAARAEDPVIHDDDGVPFKNLTIEPVVFRRVVRDDAASAERLEMLAALGTDATTGEMIHDSGFRTMSGAGHQHFLESVAKLGSVTRAEDIERTLFEPWTYTDDLPYLRLDPRDDRRYALRWQDPSDQSKGFRIRTVRGANRLAVEGFRLFPVIPQQREVQTTGFRRVGRETFWTWPIWSGELTLRTILSLLSLESLQLLGEENDRKLRAVLTALGVVAVFRSRRITIGKMRNFTPATAI